jgi:hypothetical protein
MPNRAGVVPFRWDVRKREQLGRLIETASPPPPTWWKPPRWEEVLREVRTCAARVLARGGDARLVFVGRSPDNLFDYLTGALAGTGWAERCDLLNLSMPGGDVHRELPRAAVEAFRAQLAALSLTPAEIASAPRVIALVDLVSTGMTYGALSESLATWGREEGVDVNAVRRRLRFVGISVRTKNSPNTWRWFQRVRWARDYPRGALRGVSIPGWFWGYLGEYQEKMMPPNASWVWGTDFLMQPVHTTEAFEALKLAFRLHEHARTRDERLRFAAELAARSEMREPWLRSLVVAVRRGSA